MRQVRGQIRNLIRQRDGNFGVMTALILPVLLGTAGMAIDATNMVLQKAQLQDATDAAALAVSSRLADKKIDSSAGAEYGKNFVAGRFSSTVDAATLAAIKAGTTVSVTTTAQGSTGKNFAVAVNSTVGVSLTPLTRLLFGGQVSVSAASKTVSGYGGVRGISMEVVLDQSASMLENTNTQRTKCVLQILNICLGYQTYYVTKADALKEAAAALFDGLDKVDPNAKRVRTGAISYSSFMIGQSTVDWGTTKARKYVTDMITPVGGTDATTSMETATKNIGANGYGTDTETVEQRKNNNTTFARAVVLMTDGEMTGNSASWNSVIDEAVRKRCTLAKAAGITVYTVAFMAPPRGQDLLKFCASADTNYYESNSVDALVTAFAEIAQKISYDPSRLTN